jgi:hypothetical protein
MIRAVRTAAHRCRVTATGWAGLNAPSATGLIPSIPTGRRAGFRASCSRQSKVARWAVLPAKEKRPRRRGRAEADQVGGVYQVRVNADRPKMVPAIQDG